MLFETEMKQIVPGLSENRKDQEQPAGLQAGTPGGDWSQIAQQRGRESFLEQSSMGDMVEPTDEPGQQMFLSRFAQVAFNRGTLAGAVLRGTGKMMLFFIIEKGISFLQGLRAALFSELVFAACKFRHGIHYPTGIPQHIHHEPYSSIRFSPVEHHLIRRMPGYISPLGASFK